MAPLDTLPARDRPIPLPVPPQRMARWRDGRPLKRWCYVGLYSEPLMLCAASVSVAGLLRQAFWAVSEHDGLRERTLRLRAGTVTVTAERVKAGPIDLRLAADGEAMAVASRHGDSYIWTRKRPLRAVGTVDGRAVELRGLLDESAGYHARQTAWRWCAGVGEAPDGAPLAWNLVEGLHDAPHDSERTAWVAGAARELPSGAIAEDLGTVRGPDGELLRFTERARRARREHLGLLVSDYTQPFGAFAGVLPGGLEVARGWGVMERHAARW